MVELCSGFCLSFTAGIYVGFAYLLCLNEFWFFAVLFSPCPAEVAIEKSGGSGSLNRVSGGTDFGDGLWTLDFGLDHLMG